ncbi:MAG: radical SAM protein [Deltaproteobacteria bacterium]|nr:radical SAM protein [Deltaproteobacteria bacterium]
MVGFEERLRSARETSWKNLGKSIGFYLPGMFSYNGLRGSYPALSITGEGCQLRCDHCRGKILEPMPKAMTPGSLVERCKLFSGRGCIGVLISGGCDEGGRLPWRDFVPAIAKVKKETGLYISIHCGILDGETASALKGAGVDQALIDVIGDDDTYRSIYHVGFGVSEIFSSMEALAKAGLPIVPHVVCGLYYGKIRGEKKALEMISRFDVEQLVIVSLMRIRGTPLEKVSGPSAEEVAEIIVEARKLMPSVRTSFGCARQRGNEKMEILAVDAGVNRMALPSEGAIERAIDHGLEIRYQRTCCSVAEDFSRETW